MLIRKSPIIIIIIIIIQRLNICLITWIVSKTRWFSYTLFLIFIGGIIILFVYIVSLASNEKIKIRIKNIIKNKTIFISILTLILVFSFTKTINLNNRYLLINQLSPIINVNTSISIIIIITYLLITLIVVIKISNKIEGPLRNMIK